jgi:UDP-N-acetylglucosamine 3-dehydrogenase
VDQASLRVGVVGLGTWGVEHVRAWLAIPGVELVAVCDLDGEHARGIAERSGIAEVYETAGEMATSASLDAVSIVNDEADRLSATLPFLEQKVHALVEKPIALTVDDATELTVRAAEAGVHLMPGHLLRFDARIATLKQRIERGELGTIRSVYARRLLPRGRYLKYARNHSALMAGIHDYDLANWFLDSQPNVVRASSVDSPVGTSPDLLWALLEYPGDRLAVVETAWVLPDEAGLWLEAELEVIGSAGVAHLHFPSDALSVYLPSGQERPDTTSVVDALGQQVGSLVDELSYFAHCIATAQPPSRVSPQDGTNALRTALAVAEAAATRSPVTLEP